MTKLQPTQSGRRPIGMLMSRMSLMAATLVSLSACGLFGGTKQDSVRVAQVDGRPGETQAERLYRHGVNCMDVIERRECAVDYFEKLLDLDTKQRDLVADALFRLVALRRLEGDEEGARLLLRRYWDVGKDGNNGSLIPYGTQYLNPDMTGMIYMDIGGATKTPFFAALDEDARDTLLTCDEARREELRSQREARAKQRRAEIAARDPERGAEMEARAKERAEERAAQEAGEVDAREKSIGEDGPCELARTFGDTSLADYEGMLSAQHHLEPLNSAVILEIGDLDRRIENAVIAGDLAPVRDKVWAMVNFEYGGGPAHLLRVDSDELYMASATEVERARVAYDAREPSINEQAQALIEEVPADAKFFFVMGQEALLDFMNTAGMLAALLPTPDGLMMSAVVYDYAGMFVRMPTQDPLRAGFLISLATRWLNRASEDADDAEAEMFENMDIARSPAGDALLFSVVLGSTQAGQLIVD